MKIFKNVGVVSKTFSILLIGLLGFFSSSYAFSASKNIEVAELALYDSAGQFAGVLETTSPPNIYLPTGEQVAYVQPTSGAIYSLNGKLIGWFSEGIVWDKKGYMVAFLEASAPKSIKIYRTSSQTLIKKPLSSNIVMVNDTSEKRPTFTYEVSALPFSALFISTQESNGKTQNTHPNGNQHETQPSTQKDRPKKSVKSNQKPKSPGSQAVQKALQNESNAISNTTAREPEATATKVK